MQEIWHLCHTAMWYAVALHCHPWWATRGGWWDPVYKCSGQERHNGLHWGPVPAAQQVQTGLRYGPLCHLDSCHHVACWLVIGVRSRQPGRGPVGGAVWLQGREVEAHVGVQRITCCVG